MGLPGSEQAIAGRSDRTAVFVLQGGVVMCQYKIRLRPEEVKDFVNAASRCAFEIDICYNRYIVDAKSIVGVLGLDLRQILTVTCHGYDASFDGLMKVYSIAS